MLNMASTVQGTENHIHITNDPAPILVSTLVLMQTLTLNGTTELMVPTFTSMDTN